ncbi:MAG TPA: PorV/PorQ family protein [Ignavibacteriales bacterium]|nr:PorV/PorQ family protein [Ignavibacteriales bacterium]HOL80485.1 PorV/PorQ family protein [Ignavibacteriales bacterium]HOM64936.1 PorV/PorQ family protein [Ignavibacteriales bacterium]HPD67957.1 PorV/PorQ family protein [Ignavibacteriales bacterium]HPP32675.1 PorV/PorQ family protein [Ignavibacteriales bacterium]
MKKYIAMLIITVFSTIIMAGDVSRKGTTGADELLIPVGARSIATAGAFVANSQGLEALYYNPAGLAAYQGNGEMMFSYMSYIADINLSYFAASYNDKSLGSVALSVKNLDFGRINVTTETKPDGDGSTYSPTFLTTTLSYAKVVTDRVTAGANLKIIYEKIGNASATGFGVDFGVQYKFDELPLWLGATIKNVGTNMKFTGQDLQRKYYPINNTVDARPVSAEITTEEFQIPSYFELSLAYDAEINDDMKLLTGFNFRNNNVMEDQLQLGVEFSYVDMFFLRAGYDTYLQNTDKNIYDYTLGFGVKYDFTRSLNLTFDYAYRNVNEKAFDANHVFSVKLGF